MRTLLAATLLLAHAAGVEAQTWTRDEVVTFLSKARVVASRPIGRGITRPYRLTLSDGTRTHDAAFQSVDQRRSADPYKPLVPPSADFVDSWRYNIAASQFSVLLGLQDMVGVSVRRSWNGYLGAMTWWVDDAIEEGERRKKGLEPPDKEAWARQEAIMRVFTQLIGDTDRNLGNNLITPDWRVVMIDFTRAFRRNHEPAAIGVLRRCDRQLLARIRALTTDSIREAVDREFLTAFELEAILKRRDRIVVHFDRLITQLGEDAVLF